MIVLTKQEFEEWKSHPTTRKVQALVGQYVQEQRNTFSRNVGFGKNEKEIIQFMSFYNGIEFALDVDNLLDFDEEKEKT